MRLFMLAYTGYIWEQSSLPSVACSRQGNISTPIHQLSVGVIVKLGATKSGIASQLELG